MVQRDDDALVHIRIDPALPCCIPGCGHSATSALAEPEPGDHALWQLLPVCDVCMARLQERARATITRITRAREA
jgi:hypothetical protein